MIHHELLCSYGHLLLKVSPSSAKVSAILTYKAEVCAQWRTVVSKITNLGVLG